MPPLNPSHYPPLDPVIDHPALLIPRIRMTRSHHTSRRSYKESSSKQIKSLKTTGHATVQRFQKKTGALTCLAFSTYPISLIDYMARCLADLAAMHHVLGLYGFKLQLNAKD